MNDFPPSNPQRSGWPWAGEIARPVSMTGVGPQWPRLTVVTPSYNQGGFIEETIRSVLLQGYPNLEYIIIDGGSQDGSVEIIRKYESWLAYWVSEPDRGASHAINKGLARATGEIVAWLNSDDTYLLGTVQKAMAVLGNDSSVPLLYGSARFVDAAGNYLYPYQGRPLRPGVDKMKYWLGWDIPQPTLFFRRQLLEQFGFLDESYQFCFDYEWLIRVSQSVPFTCLDEVLATYRVHSASKTGDWEANKHRFFAEAARANRKYAPLTSPQSWPLWVATLRYEIGQLVSRIRRPNLDNAAT